MKKIFLLISFAIFFMSCENSKEKDFFQKKYDTNNVEILSLLEEDSTYSPHETIDKLYKQTHTNLNQDNYDSLFTEFLKIRRNFTKPETNNCIKKTYAIKINDNEPTTHTIYYIMHRGKVCMHDKEMIFRQFVDVEHNFLYYITNKQEYKNNKLFVDSCQS